MVTYTSSFLRLVTWFFNLVNTTTNAVLVMTEYLKGSTAMP